MLEDRSYMQGPEFRMRHAFPVTIILLVINLAVFVFLEINKAYNPAGFRSLYENFALSTAGLSHWHLWQLVTFQVMHADRWHFIFNMLMLFFLGRSVEESIGGRHMILLYVLSGVVGGLVEAALGLAFPTVFYAPVVGASACVLALLAAFARLDPNREILLFFVLPVRAKYLFYISAVIAAFYVLVPAERGIAHGAHLGGLLAGAAYVRWIIQSPVPLTMPALFRRRSGPRLSRKHAQKQRIPLAEEEELPPEEFISREVDPILEKISAHGIHSLTTRERRILEAARAKMEKR
jgi:membrane associated rhomboid family serine protease